MLNEYTLPVTPLNLPSGIHDVSEDDYHNRLTGFSNTDLKLVARSPAHYYAARLDPNREPETVTPPKLAGRILHTAILEPEKFDQRFIVVPDDAPRKPSITQRNAKNPSEDSIRSIMWWDEFELQFGDRQIISAKDQKEYTNIANAVRGNPAISKFLEGAMMEKTFVAVDPETGLKTRCRTDIVNVIADYTVVIDLKSCEDARTAAFARAAYNYGYFHQDAFYRDTIANSGWGNVDLFLFAGFEKEAPYASKTHQSSDDAISRAREQYKRSLRVAAECTATGQWPAYSDEIEVLEYPAWAKD